MASPFIGQIMTFAGNFAPRGYALCQGQLIAIQSNTALFALLGTTYGGNGTTTYALPDLRGRAMVHEGQGAGLPYYNLGQLGGTENISLLSTQLPAHTHTATFTPTGQPSINATTTKGNSATPTAGAIIGRATDGAPSPVSQPRIYAPAATTPAVTMGAANVAGTVTVGLTGNNLPVSTLTPYLTVSVCIATQGIFPARN